MSHGALAVVFGLLTTGIFILTRSCHVQKPWAYKTPLFMTSLRIDMSDRAHTAVVGEDIVCADLQSAKAGLHM